MTGGAAPIRYARALAAIGEQTGTLAALHREWNDLRATVEAMPAALPSLINPRVPVERRREALDDLLRATGASRTTRAAAMLLFGKGRLLDLPHVAGALDGIVRARTGQVGAAVTTAASMPDAFHERLKAALERATGKTLVVERSVDPGILGGVVARVGDILYDGSVRTALARLRERLMET